MNKFFSVIAAILFFSMLYLNSLSGAGKINNISTGDISALYPTRFTPAGFTFAVWGLIYLANLVFIINLLWQSFSPNNRFPDQKTIGLHASSSILNMIWLFTWHYQALVFSELVMAGLLGVLIILYLHVQAFPGKRIADFLMMVVPVSFYLSWIIVAFVANSSILLVSMGWKGFGIPDSAWASGMVLVAGIINILVLIRWRDIFFALIFLWAAMGIIVARRGEMDPGSDQVALTALVSMILVFIFIILVRFFIIRRERTGSPNVQ